MDGAVKAGPSRKLDFGDNDMDHQDDVEDDVDPEDDFVADETYKPFTNSSSSSDEGSGDGDLLGDCENGDAVDKVVQLEALNEAERDQDAAVQIEKNRRGQKRTRHPSEWKRNSNRGKGTRGLAYTNRSGVLKDARALERYDHNCRYKCNDNISEEKRGQVFNEFWNLGNYRSADGIYLFFSKL